MSKIRSGDMYMVAFDHPSKLYGWSVHRIWWKPWRYNVRFYYIRNWAPEVVFENLSLDGVKGTLKLFELWKE